MTYATPAVAANRGDSLRFTNLDPLAQHDLDSDEADLFESALVSAGQDTKVNGVEKLKPGTYAFHCSLHSWMKGVLNVSSAQGGGGGGDDEAPPEETEGTTPFPDPATLAPPADPTALGKGRWPVYGHDRWNSRTAGGDAPSVADAINLGPVWSVKSTDGDFTGTPVVDRGTLVMGSSGGTVYAVDASTGELRWKRDLLPKVADEQDARITASAAIYKQVVYVPVNRVGRPAIVALSLKRGKLLWQRVVDRQKRADMYGSPQVSRGVIYVGTSGYFGEQVTGVEVSARGSIVALGARKGRIKWKTFSVPPKHDGGAVWSTPAIDVAAGRIYVGTGNAYHEPVADTTDSLLMLSARTGRLLEHFQAIQGDAWNGVEDSLENPDGDFGSSPNLFRTPDGRKVVGAAAKTGLYWALDREAMVPVWTAFTGAGSFQGGTIGSTAFDGKRIYGSNSLAGGTWGLATRGGLSWQSADGAPLHYGATSAANGVVYSTSTNGFLTAREAGTGVVLAKLALGAPSWAGIAIAGGYVFTATGSSTDTGYIVGYRAR